MTAATLSTSAVYPRLCARGSVTRDGTKKTESHLARTAAPGERREWMLSPMDGLMEKVARRKAKRVPHPAREDGKDMERALRSLRNATSSATRAVVETNEVRMVGEDGDGLGEGGDGSEVVISPMNKFVD